MLSVIFDHEKTGLPFITIVFAVSCVIVSVPTLFMPDLYGVFGGYKPLNYPWQKFTLAFEHGFNGLPLLVHLILNFLLLWFCGVWSEKILGSARFFMLTVAAMLGFAASHSLPFIDGHGSSGVIWAYSPIVFMTMMAYRKLAPAGANSDTVYQRARIVLIVMWGAVTFFMTVIPYMFGWKGNPLLALLLGNTFHISATAVGFVFAFVWRDRIQQRLRRTIEDANGDGLQSSLADRIARGVSLLIPAGLLAILLLAITEELNG